MPHYPQQQHHSLVSSSDRRRHLNLLLFDQLDEIKRIYAGTGRMPTYSLGRARTAPAGTVSHFSESLDKLLFWEEERQSPEPR
jgi:hypothetical protein